MALYTTNPYESPLYNNKKLYKSGLYDMQQVHENGLYSTRHYSSKLYEGEKTPQEKGEEGGLPETITLPTDGLVQWLFSPTSVFSNNQITDAQGDETRTIHPGRAYSFDGVDDYVSLPTSILSRLGGDLTISGWISISSISGNSGSLLDCGALSVGRRRIFSVVNGRLFFASFGETIYGITLLPTNTLVFITATLNYSTKECKLYFNGVLDKSGVLNNLTTLGTVGAQFLDYLNGTGSAQSIHSNIRYYDKILSQDEITYLCTNGQQGIDPGTTNLVAHYKCEEGSGTTAYDSSGNGNHGTMYNITPSTFHTTDPDISYSYLNEEGYTDSSGVYIPALDDGSGNDALGNPLQYTGRVKYNADLVESNCATFDGVNDYIKFTGTSIIPGIDWTLDITLECWLNISFVNRLNILTKGGSTIASSFGSYIDASGTIYIFYHNGVGFNFVSFYSVYSSYWNQSTHFCIVRDSNVKTYTLYINGINIGSRSYLNSVVDTGGDWRVGKSSDYSPNGKIYAVKIWSRSLSEAEVLESMTGVIQNNTGLVLYCPISEGAGTTIYDVSGNGNHGTAYNITESSFWGNTQDVYHYNITKGFTLSGSTRIPALLDGSADASGGVLTNPAGNFHNNAETKLKMSTTVPALRHSTFWYDAAGVPQARSYSEIVANWNIEDITFADVSITNEKKNLVTYDSAQVDPELSQIKKYLNQ